MVSRQLSQFLQCLESLLVLILPEKPQGTLVKPPSTGKQRGGWDDLNGHGDSPCCGAGLVQVLVDAVIDPKSDKGAGLVSNFEETGQDAADRGDRELGDVAGHSGGDGTAGKTSENTTSVWDC